jgi:hypothetical protein
MLAISIMSGGGDVRRLLDLAFFASADLVQA